MTNHRPEVQRFRDGRLVYAARCSCGWQGRLRLLRFESVDDGREHLVQVRRRRPSTPVDVPRGASS